MITIEEAKGLGFVENEPWHWSDKAGHIYDIAEDVRMSWSIADMWLETWEFNEGVDDKSWFYKIDLSHLNAEQVKQLITLLKP